MKLLINHIFRSCVTAIFLLAFQNSYAQNGYIKTNAGIVTKGWIKTEVGYKDRGTKILFYETRKSRKPEIYFAFDLAEYAVSNDTLVILKAFYPFENDAKIFYQQVEANVVRQGKVQLLSVFKNNTVSGGSNNPSWQNSGIDPSKIYILKMGELAEGVSPNYNSFLKTLNNFFYSDQEIMEKVRLRKYRYKDLIKIVESYNN